MNLIIIENSVTLVDGTSVYHGDLTDDQISEIHAQHPNYDSEEIKRMICPLSEEEVYNEKVTEIIDVIEEHEDFKRIGDSFYRIGIELSLPVYLLDKYRERIQNGESYENLDNFWKLAALNPNPQSRTRLIEHIDKYGLVITNSGYFITYRNLLIHKQKGNHDLEAAISQFYLKVRTQKKSPKNYEVWDNMGEYQLNNLKTASEPTGMFVGNLEELNNQEFGTVYTDSYSKTFRIKLGEVVSMPREECDETDATCSRGMHSASANWLNAQGSGYFGSTGIVCLINPMDVVAAPMADGYGKLRSCSYLPIAIAEKDENGLIIPIETSDFELTYDNYVIKNINERLAEMSLEEFEITTLKLKALPNNHNIFHDIEGYHQILNKKHIDIYEKQIWSSEEE